jgi:uncharacterized protein YjbI with pentapeptide repeats
MANQEHIDLIKQGTAVWNAWRLDHPDIRPDLFGANFRSADLTTANLSRANLFDANLSRANLFDANLTSADLTSADLSRANLFGTNLFNANLRSTDLRSTDLRSTDLRRADLSRANLFGASLRIADLRRADLTSTDLTRANLFGASLFGATLRNAVLFDANLSRADLRSADLTRAVLISADLTDADFSQARFGWTTFIQVDLNDVKGLETAKHDGPSAVNINTIVFLHDEVTRNAFLRGVGFTETQIEYLPSLLTPQPIEYQSLFISYAHQDDTLAKHLYADLRKKDVPCWFAPHDLRPGDYHHSRIDEAIHLHDKTLLLLSEHAVNSSWVKHEVQIALAREIDQDCTVLFPLRLDEAIMQTNKDWAVRLRATRHIGDFTSWRDEAAYQQAFSTLLQHLKVVKP